MKGADSHYCIGIFKVLHKKIVRDNENPWVIVSLAEGPSGASIIAELKQASNDLVELRAARS